MPDTKKLPSKQQLIISSLLLLGVILVMRYQGAALIKPATPSGILALEFANTLERLSVIQSVWEIDAARLNIWLDFGFIITYTWFFLNTLSIAANQWRNGMVLQLGKWLIRLAWMAALFDILENILMLFSLAGHYNAYSLQATTIFAAIKFLIVLLIILYLLASVIAYLISPKNQYGK